MSHPKRRGYGRAEMRHRSAWQCCFDGPGSIRRFLCELAVCVAFIVLAWAFLVIAPGIEMAILERKQR